VHSTRRAPRKISKQSDQHSSLTNLFIFNYIYIGYVRCYHPVIENRYRKKNLDWAVGAFVSPVIQSVEGWRLHLFSKRSDRDSFSGTYFQLIINWVHYHHRVIQSIERQRLHPFSKRPDRDCFFQYLFSIDYTLGIIIMSFKVWKGDDCTPFPNSPIEIVSSSTYFQ